MSGKPNKPLAAWVVVEEDGLEQFDHCTCMAGEVCSHVGAIGFNKLSGTICTDEACVWNNFLPFWLKIVKLLSGGKR